MMLFWQMFNIYFWFIIFYNVWILKEIGMIFLLLCTTIGVTCIKKGVTYLHQH